MDSYMTKYTIRQIINTEIEKLKKRTQGNVRLRHIHFKEKLLGLNH